MDQENNAAQAFSECTQKPANHLCAKCQVAFRPWPRQHVPGENRFGWYDTVAQAQYSASRGCSLCIQLLKDGRYSYAKNYAYLTRENQPRTIVKMNERLEGKLSISSFSDNEGGEERWEVGANLCWYDSLEDEKTMTMKTWSAKTYLFRGALPSTVIHNISNDYGLNIITDPQFDSLGHNNRISHALALCKQWLQQCDAAHTCRAVSDIHPEALPTRLIKIDGDKPQLCIEMSNIPVSTTYATLSHCWGLKKFLTLCKSNLSEFTQSIPANSLTKTFREAISIAKYLNFKYIWIDSLCIIQDDAEDWKRESVRMGSIYGRSGLNIAATAAPDGEAGCWLPRDENWICNVSLGENGPSPTLYGCFTSEMLSPKDEDVPLMRRAWVIQERFLSPRTLHFTKNQVFWVCRSLTACEVWPGGIPRPQNKMFPCSMDLPKGSNWLSLSGWPAIVSHYAYCNLTFGRDKLVAISAIAQLIQKNTKDSYIAGMWRDKLEDQLYWSPERGKRYKPATAPTWSWASNSGFISYFGSMPGSSQVTKRYIEICDIDIEYITPSEPFGGVIKGTLHIRCEYLKECTMYASKRRKGIIIDEERVVQGEPKIEDVSFDDFDEHAGNEKFRAFWLPIWFKHETTSGHRGIVLQPTGARKGEYRRIGSTGLRNTWRLPDHHFPSERFRPKDDYCSRVEDTGFWKRKREFYISIL